ncbi:Hypothetical protein NTJ_14932 [Nesidiocoris tenuis]|uniref:CARMIL C-terminal domain-containing protein n=1 Tax=Nesidiocoris tenuis TaxID=355587 RepID=A0ABN7BCY2_9HEMI|nr:Hypothetical protein NTJ_14932 [Nesidiocoris tenuis]
MEVERCPDAILHSGLPSAASNILKNPTFSEPSTAMMDQFNSAEDQSSSTEMKKRTFNIKKTAINMVNGIRRKKKDAGEMKSKSQDDVRNESGDQTAPTSKQSSFNKMLNHLPKPRLNLWKKSPNPQNEPHAELDESRSTMTLGRIFGRKKETSVSAVKEERKSLTLGRMFTFKSPIAPKVDDPANSPPKIESDD